MMKPHTKKKGLEAPEFAKKHWTDGNKTEMTLLLRDCNFCKDMSALLHYLKYVCVCMCRHLAVTLINIFAGRVLVKAREDRDEKGKVHDEGRRGLVFSC